MVQINLLPVTAKKKLEKKVDLKIKVGPLIFTLIGVMLAVIVVWAILGIGLSAEQKKAFQLDEHLKSSGVTLQKLDNLNKDKKQLQDKLEFLDEGLTRKVIWAKNLNRLSNLVPSGIWFKRIVLRTSKEGFLNNYVELAIDGSAVSLQEEEMIDLIGEFMSALKKDEIFSKQFSEIKLISSQRRKSGKIEIMDFKLLNRFR